VEHEKPAGDTSPVTAVWQCKEKCFLKGLAIVGDIAYFGRSPPQKRMNRMEVNCDLLGVDLNTGKLILEHKTLTTDGLLNHVGHPDQLSVPIAGTVVHITRHAPTLVVHITHHAPTSDQPSVPIAESLDLGDKMSIREDKTQDHLFKPYTMHGPLDITMARRKIIASWSTMWKPQFDYPDLFPGTTPHLFPGVQHHRLLFSSGKRINTETDGAVAPGTCIELPGWSHFRQGLMPVLDALLGRRLGVKDWESRLLRMQLNLMPKGSAINPHRDSGDYPLIAHRIHIPLFIPKCISFLQKRESLRDEMAFEKVSLSKAKAALEQGVGDAWVLREAVQTAEEQVKNLKKHTLEVDQDARWAEVPFKEGEAFEICNVIGHRVFQYGPFDRVTLMIDLLQSPCKNRVKVKEDCMGKQEEEEQ
jgi:hypothetical protein